MEDIFGLYLDDDESARQKALVFAQALRAAKQRQQQSGLWEQVASLGANPVLQGAVGTSGHAAQRAGQEATQYRALSQDAAKSRQGALLRLALEQEAQRRAQGSTEAQEAQRAQARAFQREMMQARLKGERENQAAKLASEKPERQRKDVDALREEYGKNPVVLNASKVSDAFRSMKRAAAQNSGPGDVALVYKFITFLDPQSAVKEGEIDIARASQGPAARYLTTWDHVKQGNILSPAARQEMITTAESIIGDRMRTADEVKRFYREMANRRGFAEEDVFVPTGAELDTPEEDAETPAPVSPSTVPVGTVKEWQGKRVRKLSDGSWEEVD